jgi:hypothetical protein
MKHIRPSQPIVATGTSMGIGIGIQTLLQGWAVAAGLDDSN